MATSKEQKETVYKSIGRSHYKYHQKLGENSMALGKKKKTKTGGLALKRYFLASISHILYEDN